MRIFFTPANDPDIPDPRITPREREVVTLVADGCSNKVIAMRLGISLKTVEAHRANVMRKLDLPSSAHMVRYAVLAHLVSL